MRRSVILAVLVLWACSSPAETIRLKNGRVIYADRVSEKDGRVSYEVGDNTFTIPKNLVERIDTGGQAPVPSAHRADDARPAADDIPIVNLDAPGAQEISARVIQNGRVDEDALASIEAQRNVPVSALAYDIAGLQAQTSGDNARAAGFFRHGLSLAPENPYLLAHYVALLLNTQRYVEALPHAEHAARLAPTSADVLALLGFAYFFNDRTRDAVTPWKKSLALRPNESVKQYLAKAERELAAEANFGQQASSHFTLRYEGSESPPALRRQLLAALEADYDDLVRELGVAPRESIPVVLYANQAFEDVTQAPSWADAVNDGKLRIPLDHLATVTPELARVLKHELAHTFIHQLSRGRAPQWLHEGVAQALEPRTLAMNGGSNGRWMARIFASGHQAPFNMLEQPFTKLSGEAALVAYMESLAAVEYIRSTYGMDDVCRVLQRIGEGSSTEAALRATIHSGYDGLEQDVGAYLKRTYGN
ncbi:MAG TPA: hypothetical protein VFA60_01240 [Terriglobales bacterium]|nr:hypothetical protein [Terriglobales bacterium]